MKSRVCIESLTRFGKELFKLSGANKIISIIGNAKPLPAIWYFSPTDRHKDWAWETVLLFLTIDTDHCMRKNIPIHFAIL